MQHEPLLILSPSISSQRRNLLTNFFLVIGVIAIAGYATMALIWLARLWGYTGLVWLLPRDQFDKPLTAGDLLLTISGICALALVSAPIIWSALTSMSFSRIWAIAQLSFKQAVRNRILWVFGLMALVFLFADWFVDYKAENQVRNYVRVVYWSLAPLFVTATCLLGAFSIDTDVRNNAIHTIVTKPVVKFEIVLGRFLGYAILLTMGLFFLAIVSLGYVIRGVNDEAKNESYKARVVSYGKLQFWGTKSDKEGVSVGREWNYRTYITGPTTHKPNVNHQYAIWDFAEVPSDLGERKEPVRFEFAFDIFRLSKGDEGTGMFCTFTFAEGSLDPQQLRAQVTSMAQESNKLQEAATKERDKKRQDPDPAIRATADTQYDQQLKSIKEQMQKKYRLFQANAEVTDYHTQFVEVPPEVFSILLANAGRLNVLDDNKPFPKLRVFVSVDMAREAQMLGVAQQDFYLLAYEKSFWQNFLKGIVGMWCSYMLILGVAIACSTYLTSVISLLATLFLCVVGMLRDYLQELTSPEQRQLEGGGPAEALLRITKAIPLAGQIEESPTKTVVQAVDSLFGRLLSWLMHLIPDFSRHDLHVYVANGFDIGWLNVLLLDNFLPLAGYLIPWAILAYYLMNYREIANPS
jgi:hypothetical protein